MSNTILLKKSGTANAVPLPVDLALGEVALNYTDGNLFYKDAGGTVNLLVSNKFVSVTGNITGGNLNAAGLSLSSNVVSALNVTGAIAGANLTTPGLISATGTITGGNIAAGSGTISTSGNITGGNLSGTNIVGTLTTAAQTNITSVGTLNGVAVAGTGLFDTIQGRTGGDLPIYGVANANIIIGPAGTGRTDFYNKPIGNINSASVIGNVVGGNINTGGQVSATGNITGNYILGNIANATGYSASKIYNGVSEVNIATANGNANISINGTSNVVVVTATGLNVTGTVSASGNVTGGNLITSAAISAASVSASGNITGGNVSTAGYITANGGAYGEVTTTPFASMFAAAAGPNPYSVIQVRSSDNVSGLGMQAFTGTGILYANAAINFVTGATLRDKDVYTGGATRATLDSTGLSLTGNVTSGNLNVGAISLTGNIISVVNVSSSITAGSTISAVGNIIGGNVNTVTLSATGNVNGGNVNATTGSYVNGVSVLTVNATIDGGTY